MSLRQLGERDWQSWLLFMVGSVAYAGLVYHYWQTGSLTFANIPTTLRWYALAFIAYIAMIVWAEYRGQLSLKFIFAGAILFRVMLWFTLPTLSGDVHRYVWDGYVANQGISPYAFPVNAPQLDDLATPQRDLVDHAEMASPYLPGAQALFFSTIRLFPDHPRSFQIVLTLFDLLTGYLLVQLLRKAELPDYRVLIYLWNPLAIVEVAHGAHIDAWMLFLSLLALWLTYTERWPKLTIWLAPIVLALATLTKGLPLLLLAVLFWRWRWWQLVGYSATIATLVVPIGLRVGWGLTTPLDAGNGLFGTLRIFLRRWNYNSGLFHWLEIDLAQRMPLEMANTQAKWAVGVALLLVIIGTWLVARHLTQPRSLLRVMSVPFMAYLLFSATVHPWYPLILLGFLPFLPPAQAESKFWFWLGVTPWLYLSWAISLSYWTYINPFDLREFEWVRQTEWYPTVLLLIVWGIIAIVPQKVHRVGQG